MNHIWFWFSEDFAEFSMDVHVQWDLAGIMKESRCRESFGFYSIPEEELRKIEHRDISTINF